MKIFLIKLDEPYNCDTFTDGGFSSTTNYDKYCYESKIDSQDFCIGQSGTSQIQCTNFDGGIQLVFDTSKSHPMRLNKMGEATCQNYHPNHLQNLAKSLGYSTYRIKSKKTGNSCTLVWLDSSGNFQTTAGSSAMELPFDVSFWGNTSG